MGEPVLKIRSWIFPAAAALGVLVFVIIIFHGRKIKPPVSPVEIVQPEKLLSVAALVLDDFGYSRRNLAALKEVGVPLTMAVLPHAPYTEEACSFAKKNGFEVILHLPMEPEGQNIRAEEDTIAGGMGEERVTEIMIRAFKSVPPAKGASNHMGSRATADARVMSLVLDDMARRGIFFLDSYTTKDSVCADVALEKGVPCVKRDIFLDNKNDEEYIKEQIRKFERMVLDNGFAVAIGHDRPITISVLKETVAGMKERGIRFVRLSEFIQEHKVNSE
ncbi:MAG: divergent polysaccharide deacetylase family protein [Candidatus Omnitrophota bacterium]